MGSSSPIFGVKIKNIWNHHPVINPPKTPKNSLKASPACHVRSTVLVLGIEAKTKDGARACWRFRRKFNGRRLFCSPENWPFFCGKAGILGIGNHHFQVLWCFQTLKKCTLGPYTPDETNKKNVPKLISWWLEVFFLPPGVGGLCFLLNCSSNIKGGCMKCCDHLLILKHHEKWGSSLLDINWCRISAINNGELTNGLSMVMSTNGSPCWLSSATGGISLGLETPGISGLLRFELVSQLWTNDLRVGGFACTVLVLK